jgi:hypothetical protein
MASIHEGLEQRLAAVAATVAPGPLLERQPVSHAHPAPAMRVGFRASPLRRERCPAKGTVLLTSPWLGSICAFAQSLGDLVGEHNTDNGGS